MNKWLDFAKALMQTEEQVLPIFVHNPQSQSIVGIILVAESIALAFAQSKPADPTQGK